MAEEYFLQGTESANGLPKRKRASLLRGLFLEWILQSFMGPNEI